jgi:hypothetical protein
MGEVGMGTQPFTRAECEPAPADPAFAAARRHVSQDRLEPGTGAGPGVAHERNSRKSSTGDVWAWTLARSSSPTQR